MDIEPQIDFFSIHLKSFIIQEDQQLIEKILLRTEQLINTDHKITVVNIKLS